MDKHIIIDNIQTQEVENVGCQLDHFEILQTLGKGGFGFVAKVKSKLNHKLYAMKMIDFNAIKDPTQIQLSLNEMNIIKSLNNPHIIKYYNSFKDNNKLYIIMEFMNNGDFKGYIEAHKNINKPIPETELWEFFYQCAAGLCYIHSKNLIHRDIKPANLFMTDDKAIKIGDFGVSAIINGRYISGNNNNSKEKLVIGTPTFMSPEMCNYSGYGNKVDVYALGFTFHMMCYYDPPRAYEEILDNLNVKIELIDKPPTFNRNIYSKEINDLIQWMIKKDEKERPTSFEVLNYIKKIYCSRYKQNTSIHCIYRCLLSFLKIINYIKINVMIIKSSVTERPIFTTLLLASEKIDGNDWLYQLNDIRDVLIFQNPCLTDPGEIDPIDLLKFILERMHKESRLNNNIRELPYLCTNININYSNALNEYLTLFRNYQSFVSDCFFGTYEITKLCYCCKRKSFYFQNFIYTIFNIDESLKNGLNGCDILYYINKQNSLLINNSSFCIFCKQITQHQEMKKFFTLPFHLIICFKGEKQFYNSQYIKYPIILNLSSLGLKNSPIKYNLKGIIKTCVVNDKKIYSCIYPDYSMNKWVVSDGYSKIYESSPYNNTNGDVVMLFYSSLD